MAVAIFKDIAVGGAFNGFYEKCYPTRKHFFVSSCTLLCQKQCVCQH